MFKIGDKVTLKSGGSVMTITGFSPRGSVWIECPRGHLVDGTVAYYELAYGPDELIAAEPR